jgi:hypothetical protein
MKNYAKGNNYQHFSSLKKYQLRLWNIILGFSKKIHHLCILSVGYQSEPSAPFVAISAL